MILYFPPKATAGFANLEVKTPSRLPCPPANNMAIISFFIIKNHPFVTYMYIIPFPFINEKDFSTKKVKILLLFYINCTIFLSQSYCF